MVGELVVGLRTGESRLAAADERVLALLAAPIGVAVRASRLAEEVARSRERIIGSREEERRRLRRDLHDGLGPVLTGVTLNAETALRLLPDDPDRAADAAGRAAGPDHGRDRRHPAAGRRPRPAGGAGRARAGGRVAGAGARSCPGGPTGRRWRFRWRRTGDLGGLPAAVEVAIYRIVTEALTNVVRHSTASAAAVSLAASDGWRTGDDQ